MRIRHGSILLLIGIAASMVVAACSGGGRGSGLPEEAVTVDPKDLVFAVADVPDGFELDESKERTNRDVARNWPDPDQWLQKYKDWGRLNGFTASFQTGILEDEIESGVDVYATTRGAQDAFDEERQNLEREFRAVAERGGFELKGYEMLDPPSLGHDAYMVRAGSLA